MTTTTIKTVSLAPTADVVKRTNAQTVYSRLHHVNEEYDEMVCLLQQVLRLTEVAADGTKVDWPSVSASIRRLRAFQLEVPS
jgi:hypothetical protein